MTDTENTLQEVRLILADVVANSNKFWHARRAADHSVHVEWGRVGEAGQSQLKQFADAAAAEKFIASKRKEKERKGYSEQKTIGRVERVDAGALVATDDDPVTRKLLDQLTAKGTLSEAQVAAVRRFIAGQAERDARRAAEATEAAKTAQPFPVGRQTVTGTVVSTKTVDSHYGGLQLKMLVKTDDGNRVFGTAPESLQPSSDAILALKGSRVRFTAEFQVSRDDPHFGFYKRPTNAVLA